MRRSVVHIVLACVLLGAPATWMGCGARTGADSNDVEVMAVVAGSDDSEVVATVAGAGISAREFRLSYELGSPGLKTGEDPVGAYLDRMIDEKLLAIEGRRLGHDTTAYVRDRVMNLMEQLKVEEVFRTYVNDRVKITEADIDEYHRREHVQFRLRYLPAPTPEAARRLAEVNEVDGFDEAVALINRMSEGEELPRAAFETGYLSHDDLEPEVLEAIADAPAGRLVGPVEQRGSYLMIEVADIRQIPMTPEPSAAERERYRQILFQREAARLARAFVGETMQPVGLRLRGPVVRELERRLFDWMSAREDAEAAAAWPSSLADQIRASSNPAEEPAAEALRALFDDVVMTTSGGEWTVGRFLDEYPVARYPLSTDSYAGFRSDLYDAFGLTLRDETFIGMAEAENLVRSDSLKRVIRLWEDKWIYESLVSSVRASIDVSDEQARAWFDRHRDFWPEDAAFEDVRDDVRVRALRAMTAVRIAEELDRLRAETRITVNRPAIDSAVGSAEPGPPVSVVALHTGRPAFPVVDPALQ